MKKVARSTLANISFGSARTKGGNGWPPTVGGKLREAGYRTVREWRALAIIALLAAIFVMLLDVDYSIKLGMSKEQSQSVTYSDIKSTMREHPSFISYYTKRTDSTALLLELPVRFIKTANRSTTSPFVISATFAKGLLDDKSNVYLLNGPAASTENNVFYFNLTADHSGVDMVRQQYLITTSSPENELALSLGAQSSRVTTLPIVTINADGDNSTVVVDAAELIKAGFFISSVDDAPTARLDPAGCTAYPRNLAITVEYMMPLSDDDPSLVPVFVTYSLAMLPDEPITPRALDPRVGYFYHAYTDLGDHRQNTNMTHFLRHESEGVDTRIRVINRRRLTSGPNFKPITYYVDPTVPDRWRPAFKAGVEAWRPAFEAAGFGKEAIRAVLPGDADWPADYAPGDIRYSTINWVVSLGKTFALGPSIVDPRSGEILDSDILFTHGWVKHFIATFEVEDVGIKGNPPIKTGLTSHDDHDHDHIHDHDFAQLARRRGATTAKSMASHRSGACQHERMNHDVSPFLNRLALGAGDPTFVVGDDVIMAGLKDVVMHEVGHTLGLRHNFKASSGVTWEQTQDIKYTQTHGLSLSVMDYLPVNVVAKREKDAKVDFFMPVLGEYDIMAIKYGYMELPPGEEKPGMPHPSLTKLADANLPFATDEDDSSAMGADPSVSSFDFSADPARYFLDRLDLVAELRPALLDRVVFGGDEYTRFGAVDQLLRNTTFGAAQFLVKYIGGYTVEHRLRSLSGEHPAPPIEVIKATDQARALKGILRVLSDDDSGELFMKPELAAYAVSRGGECKGFWEHCLARAPVDMLKQIDDARVELLRTLLNETRLSRLRTADWMLRGQGKETLSVADLLHNVTAALWGPELALSARLSNTRSWTMAVGYVDRLIDLSKAQGLAPEIVVTIGGELYKVQDSITTALSTGKVTPVSPTYPLLRTVQSRLGSLSSHGDKGQGSKKAQP